jgi:hypothetical protein
VELSSRLAPARQPTACLQSYMTSRLTLPRSAGHGCMSRLTLVQLTKWAVESRLGDVHTGRRIPAPWEVLRAAGHRHLVNSDLKMYCPADTRLGVGVIDLVKRLQWHDSVLLSSFNALSSARGRQIAPNVLIGLLYTPGLRLPLRRGWFSRFIRVDPHHQEHGKVDNGPVCQARNIVRASPLDGEFSRRDETAGRPRRSRHHHRRSRYTMRQVLDGVPLEHD